MSAPLVVGFDLDMTLIDTVPGFAATLSALGAELGVQFPTEELVKRLGPPLEILLADHLAPDQVGPAGDRFRELYPDYAVSPVPLGALAAGVLSVSVLTGGSTREQLVAAGTHVVLPDLGAFPDWLERHLETRG